MSPLTGVAPPPPAEPRSLPFTRALSAGGLRSHPVGVLFIALLKKIPRRDYDLLIDYFQEAGKKVWKLENKFVVFLTRSKCLCYKSGVAAIFLQRVFLCLIFEN
jgi:hypothetical protein